MDLVQLLLHERAGEKTVYTTGHIYSQELMHKLNSNIFQSSEGIFSKEILLGVKVLLKSFEAEVVNAFSLHVTTQAA